VTVQLVEREHVLDALADHLAAATDGDGRIVLLHGEAGVGKTAVLTAFADRAGESVDVLWGWCEPLSTPCPLGPVLDIAEALGTPLSAQVAASIGVAEACRAVMDTLRAGPKVVFFEDLHWADAATLDLTAMLARRIRQVPTLLAVTYRDDEIGPMHPLRSMLGYMAGLPAVHRYSIEPLSRDGVARLARGLLPVDELYRVTSGNPFFITEVLAGSGEGIPGTVAASVSGRLARVSQLARRAAGAVSVLGPHATPDLVNALIEGAEDSLGELLGAGILTATDTCVRFRHELARLAVLEAISGIDRATLHARALQVLCTDPHHTDHPALLAHHAEAAGDAAAVVRYAPRAAVRAAHLGAHREAAAQFERTLRFDHLLSPEQRVGLLEGLAHVRMHTRFTEAVQAMRQALDLRRELCDPVNEGNDLRWLSGLLMPMGECADAWRYGQEALLTLDTLPPCRELAWAHLNLCQLSAYDQRGTRSAEEHAQRAIAIAEQINCPEVSWQAHFHLAAAKYVCGDAQDRAWADMERARSGARQAGLVDTASFLTMQAAWLAAPQRDDLRVAAMVDELEAEVEDREVFGFLLCARSYRALGLLHTGAWDAATDLATSVLDHPGAPPVSRLIPLTVLGLIRIRSGDRHGNALLNEARGSYERSGWTLLVDAARAESAWLVGDNERAVTETERGLDAVTPHTSQWCVGEVARWLRLAGGISPDVRVAEPFTLELTGAWREAAQEWERRGYAYDAALARISGDVPALLAALETFEALGARPAASIARNRLRVLGHRVSSRGPRASTRSNRYGLTNRQAEILRLVAEGLTGPQIAALLHLSHKTVDNHVNAAMAKLGTRSRADAARLLSEQGIH